MGATPLNAANFNLCCLGDGTGYLSVIGFRVYYDGAAWQIGANRGAGDQVSNITPTWDTNHVDIDISGIDTPFSSAPVMVASCTAGSGLMAECGGSSTTCTLRFRDSSHALVTTEATTMSADIILLGVISGHFSDS